MAIKDDMEDVQEAVINELISDNGLNPLTVGDLQITTAKIADDAVTLAKLGSDVDLGQVNDGAVTPAKLSQAYLPLTGGSVTGNLGISTTENVSSTSSEQGLWYQADGWLAVSRASNTVAYFNRLTNDGDIVQFRKDGGLVGSIACRSSGGTLQIYTSQSGIDFGGDGYLPMRNGAITDNSLDIGSSSFRYQDIYAINGTIQTSDRNEKQDIEELSEAEQRVAVACKGLLRKFRWKSSVEENGEEARIHFGIIAQDLQASFEAEGLDAGRYAMFISSTWTDEETGEEKTRLGVRYSELLAFIISAI